MSKKPLAEKLRKYRSDLGKQFAERYKLQIDPQLSPTRALQALYKSSHDKISPAVAGMSTATLACVIEAAPLPDAEHVDLLLPRADQHGLESLNILGLNGRAYLEDIAHCALVGAVFDYLRAQKQ
jgi:hypothetical protein